MNKLKIILAEEEEAVRRALLLTTNEQKLAKANREARSARAQMEAAKAEAALARQEARQLREHLIAASSNPIKIPFRTLSTSFTIVLLVAAVIKLVYLGFTTTEPKPAAVTQASIPAAVETPAPHRILTHKAPSAGDLSSRGHVSFARRSRLLTRSRIRNCSGSEPAVSTGTQALSAGMGKWRSRSLPRRRSKSNCPVIDHSRHRMRHSSRKIPRTP